MYKVKPNVGMMFKFQFHYENGERVDLQKATNAIVEIRTVDSSSNITSSFADDFGYDLTNNCMWVRFSADAVVTVGNVVSANLTVQIRNTTGAYEYITTAAFVNLFVISNDDDASSVNGMIIDKPVKLSAAGLSITSHSPYINADGYWVYYSDDNKTWIVSTYKATNDVIVDKDSITHLKDSVGNGSLVSTNDDKSSAGNTAIGLNCISLGSSNSNAGTSDVVLLGNGNRAKSSAINAVGVAGADVDASVAFAVGQGRSGHSGYPKNVFAISPYGDISYRPNTDTDRLTNLQSTLNLGFITNLSYNKTSKKISYYVYTPNENFPSEHKQYTIDLSTLVNGDKTVTDTSYNSTTNTITVTYNDGTTSTFALNEGEKVKSFVRTFQAASPVCFDAVTDQDGTTKTLFSPALFMKEPQTSLVLDNVYTGNSGGQTEYFKWFYDQYQITESTSSAINTFFNLPIDFATKPDCTPFDSSHVIVPTLSCMNGALANYLPLTGGSIQFDLAASSILASRATFNSSANVALDSYGSEPLTIGPASNNLGIDGNEIQSRVNGAADELFLNSEGGVVHVGSSNFSFSSDGSNYTGNAATATKLATARSITLSGDTKGTATFDGSDNITIATSTDYASSTDYAMSALLDANGNDIVSTYATKTELSNHVANSSYYSNYIKSNTWNWSGVGPQGTGPTVRKIASITDMSYLEIDGVNSVGTTGTKGIVKISIAYTNGIIISNNSTADTNFGYVITSSTSGDNGKVNIDLYLQERDGENYYNILVSKLVGSDISFESPSVAAITAPSGYVAIS